MRSEHACHTALQIWKCFVGWCSVAGVIGFCPGRQEAGTETLLKSEYFFLSYVGDDEARVLGAQDWWSVGSVAAFWQRWNSPVGAWMRRHDYEPALRAGLGRQGGALLVFALSAVLHEVEVAVPLRIMVFPYAAVGMLAQVRACSQLHAHKMPAKFLRACSPCV